MNSHSPSRLPTDLQMRIASLEAAILATHPTLPVLLREIHKQLKDDPAVVTLMSDDEIRVVVNGLKKQTKTEITQATVKSRSTKALKSVSIADL